MVCGVVIVMRRRTPAVGAWTMGTQAFDPKGGSAYRRVIRVVFWGFMIAFCDMKINQFDLFPDSLGYAIMAGGCAALSSVSWQFGLASATTILLAATSIASFFLHPDTESVLAYADEFALPLAIWFLLGGIMDSCKLEDNPGLAERASRRRIFYVICLVLTNLTALLLPGPRGVPLVVPMVVAGFVAGVLVLIVVWQAGNPRTGEGSQ